MITLYHQSKKYTTIGIGTINSIGNNLQLSVSLSDRNKKEMTSEEVDKIMAAKIVY